MSASFNHKRGSMDNHEIVRQITATKPKSVFLDGKPTLDKRQFKFGKNTQIGIKDQGLQSIRRAAFATETSDEVYESTRHYFLMIFIWKISHRILCTKAHCPCTHFYAFLACFRIHEKNLVKLSFDLSHQSWLIRRQYLYFSWFVYVFKLNFECFSLILLSIRCSVMSSTLVCIEFMLFNHLKVVSKNQSLRICFWSIFCQFLSFR